MADDVAARLAPLQVQSAPLRNKIISTLRNAVETGLLQPGARLIERDLCEQLNVSRTSLREALRELQAEGVLTHTENRGLAVGVLSREDAENAYRLRAVLEALVIEQFIERANDAEVEKLIEDGRELENAYTSGALDRMLACKRAFYDRICRGAQNGLAFDIINRLVLRTSTLRSRSLSRPERQQQSIREIRAIVTAVRARDRAAAKTAAVSHVESSAVSALGAMDAMPTAPPSGRRGAHERSA